MATAIERSDSLAAGAGGAVLASVIAAGAVAVLMGVMHGFEGQTKTTYGPTAILTSVLVPIAGGYYLTSMLFPQHKTAAIVGTLAASPLALMSMQR